MIATDWCQFHHLDWERMKARMARPLILDGRNLLDAKTMTGLGFEYLGIGRPGREMAQQTAST